MALHLRAATLDDVPRIAELVDGAYRGYIDLIGRKPRPMLDDYAEVVDRKDVTVAELDGTLAGVIVLATDEEGFVVDNVAVDPQHQGRGVGRALLDHAEAAARRAGFDSLYLFTHERGVENIALYAGRGYVEFDRRPVGDAHLVYMRKSL